MDVQINNQRVHYKGHRKECPQKHSDNVEIVNQRRQAAGADGIRHQAQNAEGGEADDPLHDLRNRPGKIRQHRLRAIPGTVQRSTGQHSPGQDADVIRTGQSVNRIIHHAENQIMQHLDNARGRRQLRICRGQPQHRRKGEGEGHRHQRSAECGKHIQAHNRLHGRTGIRTLLGQRIHNQHKDENRRHTLQGPHEQITQHGHHRHGSRSNDGNQYAQEQADNNQLDQGCLLIFLANSPEQINQLLNKSIMTHV